MPKGIYYHKNLSEEHKKKIGLKSKGNKYRLGIPHSEETKKKMSESRIGKPCPHRGHKMSEEAKIKIGNSNRGRKISDEQKERLRTLRLGTKITEEHKRKISEANRGEKSYLWQGGKSFEQYTTNWSSTLRRSIRERDNYICQMCKSVQADRAFDVHHIDYDKKNCDPRNLITLCQGCHTKTGIKGNRKLFKILLQSSQKLRSFSNNVYVS